ncbi:zinc finger protein 808-like [Chrysoperla carnea]|uniref:zinc finger protein 808-like n=1 Tax=Chrysoperla carnea TaxID=189513 RepID=UPI001D0858E0|nr:zinc finger protein 808-like [Chrysoperla carnea]
MLSTTEKIPVVKLNSLAVDNFLKKFQLKSASKPSLELLKELPRKRTHKCTVCGHEFKSSSHLTEHEKVHTGEKPLKCHVCDKAFARASNLKRHLTTHKNTSSTKSQKCRYCDYAFASKVILERHEKLHLNFREFIKIDNNSIKQDNKLFENINKQSESEKNEKCSVCNKEFLRSEIHVIGNAYKCKECAKEMLKPGKIIRQEFVYIVGDTTDFQNESEENALEDIYTPVKSYECDVCEKSFTNRNDLQQHKKTAHVKQTLKTPDKSKTPVRIPQVKLTPIKIPQIKLTPLKISPQHKCTICNRNFTTKSHLMEHTIRIHSSEKPFKCSVCSLKFTRSYNLKRHEKLHKVLKCEQCKKIFTNNEEFSKHKHKERKYKCDMCEKQFTKRRLLKKHKLLHIGIQFFECKLCEKLFSQEKFLEAHHNLAHGTQKFQCIICDDTFVSEYLLKEHVSNVHV